MNKKAPMQKHLKMKKDRKVITDKETMVREGVIEIGWERGKKEKRKLAPLQKSVCRNICTTKNVRKVADG